MDKKLAKLHQDFASKEDVKSAIIYSLRNWLAYRMQQPGETFYLERAYHGAMTAHRRNVPHVRLLTLTIFMAIEAGHLDTAATMFDAAWAHRRFLKTNEPFYYGVFLFLRAYLAIHQQKTRTAKRYHKAYTAHIKAVDYSPYYDVMLGQLHLALEEYAQAYEILFKAYSHGCQSVYLGEALFRCYKSPDAVLDAGSQQQGEALLTILTHAATQGGDISQATIAHEYVLFNAVRRNPAVGERLYALSDHPLLLKAVCANRIQSGDHSLEVNTLYRKAADAQISLSHLNTLLVQSSYANGIEDVNTHALEHFLESTDILGANVLADAKETRRPHEPHETMTLLETKEVCISIAVYICHLLLTDPAHAHLLKGREDIIANITIKALENGISGRQANSLYQFYWEKHKYTGKHLTKSTDKKKETDKALVIAKIENELQKNLTRFELTVSPKASHIFITHPQKRQADEYEFPEPGPAITGHSHQGRSPLIIEAGGDFSYVCLGTGKRTIIDEPLTIRRMVPLANADLYHHFFSKGERGFYLLAYLAAHYLDASETKAAVNNTTIFKAIPILEALQEEKSLQKSYRQTLLTHLGHLYHKEGNNAKAIEYYADVELNTLGTDDIQQILETYLAAKEYNLAAILVAQYHNIIPAPALYQALCQLLPSDTNDTNLNLAQAAYNIQLAGYHNKALLDFTLAHHPSSQQELQALSAAISMQNQYSPAPTSKSLQPTYAASCKHPSSATPVQHSSPDPRLETKILQGGLWMHKWDAPIQKAFRRLYAIQKTQKECTQFVELLTYAMLIQNLCPDHETINILEEIYLNHLSSQSTDLSQPNKNQHLSQNTSSSHVSNNTHLIQPHQATCQNAHQDTCNNTYLLLALCHTYLTHKITTFRSDKLITKCIAVQEAEGILLPAFKENKPYPHPFLEKYQPFLYRNQPGKDIRLNYRIGQARDFANIPMQYLRYGLYTAKLSLFYNETITYYYSEEMPTGSIATKEATHKNTTPYLNENHPDTYFAINNAIIYENMFRHELVEDILDTLVKEPAAVSARLL